MGDMDKFESAQKDSGIDDLRQKTFCTLETAWLLPHPPIAVHEVGRGSENAISKTVGMFGSAASSILKGRPETIVFINPHAPISGVHGQIAIWGETGFYGDLSQFGAPGVVVEFESDPDLAQALIKEAIGDGINACGGAARPRSIKSGKGRYVLDHGATVPLSFISGCARESGAALPKIVVVSIAYVDNETLFRFGKCIVRAAKGLKRKITLIASGDLSHKLKEDGPYGFDPTGPLFDRYLLGCIEKNDIKTLLSTDGEFVSRAAQCGFYGVVMLYGALHEPDEDHFRYKSTVLSYEGPFGVGYAFAKFERADCDHFVELAKHAIKTYVETGLTYDITGVLKKDLCGKAGVFVSIKKNGNLRGCIGTISPTQQNIAMEIVENAVSACSRDPRFEPVGADELSDLTVSVDVLGEAEPVGSTAELDAKRYGVIVSSGYRRGLLLPDLDGVDTPEEQLQIACAKAGIGRDRPYDIERFEVVRHGVNGTMQVMHCLSWADGQGS